MHEHCTSGVNLFPRHLPGNEATVELVMSAWMCLCAIADASS